MDWYYSIVLSNYEMIKHCACKGYSTNSHGLWILFKLSFLDMPTAWGSAIGSPYYWKTRQVCPAISPIQRVPEAVRSQPQLCRVLMPPILALPPAQLLLSGYNHGGGINDPQLLLDKTGTGLANCMRGKQDGWPGLFGACDGRRKNTHWSKQRSETCQKYSGALVTAPLPRFPGAAKRSRDVGGSLWTPQPGAVPAETMLKGAERDKKRGGGH